jgi:hypothetical protein
MNRVPSDHHFVDGAGYRRQTRATRCIIRSKETTVDSASQETRVPVPEGPVAGQPLLIGKRSTILVQRIAVANSETPYLGGDGVNSTQGYPLAEGESIELPVSAMVRIYSVQGSGLVAPKLRTLETG